MKGDKLMKRTAPMKEITVSYGQTRQAKKQFEFDRVDFSMTRSLLPDEDLGDAMIEEAEGLQVLVKNFLAGEYQTE